MYRPQMPEPHRKETNRRKETGKMKRITKAMQGEDKRWS